MDMATKKVSVTLDEGLVAEAKKRSRMVGFSAFLNEALRLHLQRDRLGGFLDELDRTYGPVPPDVQKAVDEQWARVVDEKRHRKKG